MGEKNIGYESIAQIEFARRRTYEKTAAAYAISGDESIIKRARDYVAKNSGSEDPVKQGTAEGYNDFLGRVA